MLEFEGQLYGTDDGYLLLRIPNSVAIGFYKALPETGVVLPRYKDKPFNAHLTVMRPDEIKTVGGIDNINERGKAFKYSIVGASSVPASARDFNYSRYWVLDVRSQSLSKLRRTYGLMAEPSVPFHISFAARPRYVTFENGISKLSEIMKPGNATTWKQQVRPDMELVYPGD